MQENGPGEYLCVCVTLYNFQGENEKELSFAKGEYVKVTKKNPNWWGGVGSKEGKSGYFPSNYVQEIADPEEVKKVFSNHESLMKRWALTQQDDSVFTRIESKPAESPSTTMRKTGGEGKKVHMLGEPQPGRYPWSQTFVCSCGARLPSPEVAQLHVKNFNK